MKLVAMQDLVAQLEARLLHSGNSPDGWTTTFVDPVNGERWRRIYLGSEHHGGGVPILVKEPMPSVTELLEIATESSNPAEVAASAWLLADMDHEGSYKERLVAIAEDAAHHDDQPRAALLVGWGSLNDATNLRPAQGKPAVDVIKDHEHFKSVAVRARKLLHLSNMDALLRDPSVFGLRS
jgi:hypothetical protein